MQKCVKPEKQYIEKHGRVIALLAGSNVIRLLPPLVITKEEIDTVLAAIEETLRGP